MPAKGSFDICVVGGGLIGLSVAWRAAQRGASVTVLEAGTVGSGASHGAAGTLGRTAELGVGEAGARLLDLSLRSLELWPAFAEELGVGLRFGSLLVARDADEAEALERELALRVEAGPEGGAGGLGGALPSRVGAGLEVERLRPSEPRGREPALAPTLRLALDIPGDASVDPRAVVEALVAACRDAGVDIREGERVEALPAGRVVLAAGAWSGALLEGLPV